MKRGDLRRDVARLAKKYRAGELSFEEFFAAMPDGYEEDENIADLVDLIEHESKKGGLSGVSEKEHARHVAQIEELIQRLSSSDI